MFFESFSRIYPRVYLSCCWQNVSPHIIVPTSYRLLNSKFQILVHSQPPACGNFAMAPPKRAHGIWPLSAAVETNPGPLFERAAKGPWKISLVKRKGKQKKVCAKNLRYSNTVHDSMTKRNELMD